MNLVSYTTFCCFVLKSCNSATVSTVRCVLTVPHKPPISICCTVQVNVLRCVCNILHYGDSVAGLRPENVRTQKESRRIGGQTIQAHVAANVKNQEGLERLGAGIEDERSEGNKLKIQENLGGERVRTAGSTEYVSNKSQIISPIEIPNPDADQTAGERSKGFAGFQDRFLQRHKQVVGATSEERASLCHGDQRHHIAV